MSFVVALGGDAHARGRGQVEAALDLAHAVRDAVRSRLAAAPGAPGAARFLDAQREATRRHVPEALDEIDGIAEGFALSPDEVFDFLHLGCLADLAARPRDDDGCTAFALAAPGIVAKNRDFRPEHARLQRVFLLADPAWGGRRVLCLGSLGAPGAWSSGMNSDGLALADTQIATADHAPGVLRYFLMNRVLATCATVAGALALIGSLPHAGGGSLVLADAAGDAAAVELRAGRVDVERGEVVSRTNHFLVAPEPLPASAHSAARLATLRAALAERPMPDPARILARHAPEALCRHDDQPSRTLSGAIYDGRAREARISDGPPCAWRWHRLVLDGAAWREAAPSA